MPYSFVKIEEDKTRVIGFVFFFLILFYFISIWVIVVLVRNFYQQFIVPTDPPAPFLLLNPRDSLKIIAIALCVAFFHWQYSITGLMEKILRVLKTEDLKEADTYHQMFRNIIGEVSVATGGKKMEGVIIPTSAMNAFALADFDGRAVIGVTEGLLARLTRPQIEAVVAHEAAHIVTGDCLATTVISSLFELYSSALRGLEIMMRLNDNNYEYRYPRSGGIGGRAAVLIVLVYILLSVTKVMGYLMHMFISRQREYRADAIAVRLTRDPLSLAEALYAITYRWRGASLAAEELEAIFILNPTFSQLDEEEDYFSELFSTHPPVGKRVRILLDMAHTNVESLIKKVDSQGQVLKLPAVELTPAPLQWMVHQDGQWQGPFDLKTVTTLSGLKPETWVKRLGGDNLAMAYEDLDIRNIVNQRSDARGLYRCPKCQILLDKVSYEGSEINKCSFCQGVLCDENDVQRILIRRETGFSDRIVKIGEGLKRQERMLREAKINRDPKTLYPCPRCQHKNDRMLRTFYTIAYRVEVDKCLMCGVVWFDKDELEVLQYLLEDRTQPK